MLLVIVLLVLAGCNPNSQATSMKDAQTKNPYYSRSDTTTLDVPDATWKKILPADVYAVAREEGHGTGVHRQITRILKASGPTTARCAATNCSRSDSKFASSCG
jgi:peptide-methionine (R)-S-oxide reductase